MTSQASAGLDGLELDELATFLADNDVQVAGPLTGKLLSGGKSNLTFDVSDGIRHWILRRPPLGDVLPGAHDVVREHRIMAALGSSDVPVPVMRGVCTDTTRLGAPFYVMDRVDGLVIRTQDDALSVPSAVRERVGLRLIDELVRLHETDYQAIGLGDLGRPDGYLERQVLRWGRQYEKVKVRDLSEVDSLVRALLDELPPAAAPSLVHGDYRLDNVIMAPGDSGSIAAILDWELATLGDPLADLGTLLMFWDQPGKPFNPITSGLMAVEGFPARDVVLERYLSQRSLAADHLDWYLVFAEFKLAIILEQIYARHLKGETRGEGFGGIGDMVLHLLNAAYGRAAASGYVRRPA